MKARALKKLLKNTRYIVHNNWGHGIAIASPMCSQLITVDKGTLEMKYALDTFNEGREALRGGSDSDNELLFIWDKLQDLINSGEIHDIMNGTDEIVNPLPVYTVKDGALIRTVTDEYGWPNVDNDGNLMYSNTYFRTRKEAIEYGINEYTAGKEHTAQRIAEIGNELSKANARFDTYELYIESLKILLNQITDGTRNTKQGE